MSNSQAVQRAARAINDAQHLLVIGRAGIGVDSGLPDFRGNEGFWNAYPPYRDRGLSFPSMANPAWFVRDPEFGWGFYGHRLDLYRQTEPHPGFSMLYRWALAKRSHFVFTSNVDGQFQKAGFAADRVYEVHGSIHHLQCTRPCCEDVYPATGVAPQVDRATMRAQAPLPTCPKCGDLARPNILMFGDFGYLSTREQAQSARYHAWLNDLRGDPLAIVEIGAGTSVPTVRWECEQLVVSHGASLIRINPREPNVPRGCIGIDQNGLAAIEAIAKALDDA